MKVFGYPLTAPAGSSKSSTDETKTGVLGAIVEEFPQSSPDGVPRSRHAGCCMAAESSSGFGVFS